MNADAIPLCVDLDGTLLRTDILHEMLAGTLLHPATFARLGSFLLRGKAGFKASLAERIPIDIENLPYHRPLLEWLHGEKGRGRPIVLVTAAPERMAQAVATHLGVFDLVLASNATVNLRGETKAVALEERFGARGFDYIGNDRTDLAVWKRAHAAILVDASPSLRHQASQLTRVEREFPRLDARWPAFIRAMRPYQWSKNLLVFVPIYTAGAFSDLRGWMSALLVFVAFSLAASAVYLVNDITDLAVDRRHPRRCHRASANGALPLRWSFIGAPLLAVFGVATGALAGIAPLIVTYCAMALGYSLRLKEWVVVDVLTLTALYVLRLYAGGDATHHRVSPWLLAFATFFFASLAIMKRVSEVVSLSSLGRAVRARTRYVTSDVPRMIGAGGVAAIAAGFVLAFYVQAEFNGWSNPLLRPLWAIVPVTLLWQGRMWRVAIQGNLPDDPIVFAARDWLSWLAAILILALFTNALLHR